MRRKKTLPSARVCWRSGQNKSGLALHPAVKPSLHRLSIQPNPQKDGETSAKVGAAGGGYGGSLIEPYVPRRMKTLLSARDRIRSGQ
jgi:hypothetical protein